MKQFKEYFQEANAERDRYFRNLAEGIFDKFIASLSDKSFLHSKCYGGMISYMGGKYYGFMIPFKYMDLSEEEKDIFKGWDIVLAPQSMNEKVGGMAYPPTKVIIILIPDEMAKDPISNNKEIAKKISMDNNRRRIVIHELIHLIDTSRYSKGFSPSAGSAFDKGDESAYFNSPDEFNAYFQGDISAFENTLFNKKSDLLTTIKILSSDKDKLFNLVKSRLTRLKNLTPQNIKKTYKRIYEYVENGLKPRLEETIKKYNSLENINKLLNDLKEYLNNLMSGKLKSGDKIYVYKYLNDFKENIELVEDSKIKYLNPASRKKYFKEIEKFKKEFMLQNKITDDMIKEVIRN